MCSSKWPRWIEPFAFGSALVTRILRCADIAVFVEKREARLYSRDPAFASAPSRSAWFFAVRTYNAAPSNSRRTAMANLEALDAFADPYLGETWRSLGCITRAEERDGRVEIDVTLGYPAEGLANELTQRLSAAVGAPVDLALSFAAPALSASPNL